MTSIGALLAILGFGSLILPAFGMQFRLLSAVEGAQPWFGTLDGCTDWYTCESHL